VKAALENRDIVKASRRTPSSALRALGLKYPPLGADREDGEPAALHPFGSSGTAGVRANGWDPTPSWNSGAAAETRGHHRASFSGIPAASSIARQAAPDREAGLAMGSRPSRHGSHFSYRMARIALDAGVVPDTLAPTCTATTRRAQTQGTPDEHPDKEHMSSPDEFSLVSAMTSCSRWACRSSKSCDGHHAPCEDARMKTSSARSSPPRGGYLRAARRAGSWTLTDNERTRVKTDRMLP